MRSYLVKPLHTLCFLNTVVISHDVGDIDGVIKFTNDKKESRQILANS